MRVLKRDGSSEDVSFDKVLRRIRMLCNDLSAVDPHNIAQKVCTRIYDGVKTSELDELAAQMCASLVTEHPDYGTLAGRIIVSNHQKNTSPSFSETMSMLYYAKDVHGNMNPLITEELWSVVQAHKEKLNQVIQYERDFGFDYFGFKTLERAYLMRVDGKVVERPQHMWMRVALGLHGWDLKDAIETYEMMSTKMFTHATPTLFNAGTKHHQMASCFLCGTEDSVTGMYKTISDCAQISKYAGGIGVHIHNIRARGSHIRGTNGISSGIIPMLRVYNGTARHINQAGKRLGSIAIYLEPWHADIEAFLEIRKNHGSEEERCRDLFTAMWIPDLFMKRVQENGEWSLMCPDECPGLHDVYGEEFEKLYEKYEAEGKARKKVPAFSIWMGILKSQIETGTPYLCYKDAANRKSNQKNLGVIKSSNLCVAPETLVLTSDGERKIMDLVDTEASVWNGTEWSKVTIRKTSDHSSLMRVHVKRGDNEDVRTLDCTYYHKFYLANGNTVRAADLKAGDVLRPFTLPICEGIVHLEPVVTKIEHTGRIDKTYCFNEPLRHAGIFNGVLTGQCSEIMEYSDEHETAVCNLASIALGSYVDPVNKTFDFEALHKAAAIITKNINKAIDRTLYPTPETRKSNLLHRPIGIGVQGLADAYALMRMPFDSAEAAKLNREIFETIYHGAMTSSMEIAKKRDFMLHELEQATTSTERRLEIEKHLHLTEEESKLKKYRGAYVTFDGSPLSEGKFQFDLWNTAPNGRWNWEQLREEIMKYGVRNSLLLAPMPTASTSQILGSFECFEPISSNIYQRRTLAGEFTIVNKYLIKDLIELGLWSVDMKNRIIMESGSIQNIKEIPEDIRALYKTAWELKQKVLIDQAADRGIYVCQSQSLNLFVEDPDFDRLTNMHFYAWRKGLKTGIYYLRTRPKARTMAFSMDPPVIANAQRTSNPNSPSKKEEPMACSRDNPDCLMCSA